MKCEACGGGGQVEYGAYRGEGDGPTRECRLCSGVVSEVVHESISGSRQTATLRATLSGPGLDNAIRTAREYANRLHMENERQQREAENNATTFTDEHGAVRQIRPLMRALKDT